MDLLPKIKVFGMGGTIASKGTSNSQTAGYKVGLTIKDLIDAVPSLKEVAELDYLQVANVGSKLLNSSHLLRLYASITEAFKGGFKGVVVTHGTDTIEETSFFLDLTIKSDLPLVIVGAMRPSTANSADGLMNLYQAVKIATSESSKGRGPLVVLNDRIASGFWTTKVSGFALDTFRPGEQGFLGVFQNNQIEWYYPPIRPYGHQYFDISKINELPEVIILYAYQGLNAGLIYSAVELGAKGLVFAGFGAGHWTDEGNNAARDVWVKYGVPTVYSHRTVEGSVPVANATHFDGAIASGILNPQKARILLQLCINARYSVIEIKKSFSSVYGG
ncbi:uncharacterized protein AC631_05536 [Debaryomyces fabryi]|uniref:asparaginase n=1 Tax=Debaryomyces fabryi TaxID=58627 RepID=A0A0V1PRB7_9ASCO|nr:uncharacterized protein AC631_05536 [Debaryomyces fabryi]KRZ98708.1 hypothetical protein AC631_05536 [Debaryomyces fabryi]CUM57588.1 unnamed protein product [Debaryomyces fabryi]